MIKKEPTDAGVVKDGNKIMAESADEPALDAATKIAREKILALMLLNGANYLQYVEVRVNQFTQVTNSYPKTIASSVHLLNNRKPLRSVQMFTGHREKGDIAFFQWGEREHQESSGSEKLHKKAKEDELAKAAAKKKKEKLKTIKCLNYDKMGQFVFNYTKVKKDEESIGSNGTGVDQLNFEEFEDDESCESRDDHLKIKTTSQQIKK